MNLSISSKALRVKISLALKKNKVLIAESLGSSYKENEVRQILGEPTQIKPSLKFSLG